MSENNDPGVIKSFIESEPPLGSILIFLFVFMALFIGMAFEFSGLRSRGTEHAQVPANMEFRAAVSEAEAKAMAPSRLKAAMEQVAGDAVLLEGIESADAGMEIAADEDPMITKGRELYTTKTCIACHSLDGTRGVGPSWKDVLGAPRSFADGTTLTVDDGYLRESIMEPNKKVVESYAPSMPVIPMEDVELDALVAFIKAQTPGSADDAPPEDGAAPE